MGRPSLYTDEIAAAFCERVASGQTLDEICGSDGIPSWKTVWRWLQERDAFRAQYARAREAAAHWHAERALREALATGGRRKKLTLTDVTAARLRWDALRWHAGKCAPKVYGEKVSHELTGANGGPIQHRHEMSDAELEAIAAGSSPRAADPEAGQG